MEIIKKLLITLLAFCLAYSTVEAAGTPPPKTVTCKTVDELEEAMRSRDTDTIEGNPLTVMMPKAECWLSRTDNKIKTLGIYDIIPTFVTAFALMIAAGTALGAAASGNPRMVFNTATRIIIGGVVIFFSIPNSTTGRNAVFHDLIIDNWRTMYTAINKKTAEQVADQIQDVGNDLGYMIANSPLSYISVGGEAMNGIKALKGLKTFVTTFKAGKALEAARAANVAKYASEFNNLRAAAREGSNMKDTLAAMKASGVDQKTIDLLSKTNDKKIATIQEKIKALEKRQSEGEPFDGHAKQSLADAEAAAKKAKDSHAKSVDAAQKVSKGLSWAFTLVIPFITLYSGAIYISGLTAIALSITIPFAGLSMMLGRGDIFLKILSNHIANLMVVALLPIGFMISLDIGFTQPIIAMKTYFIGFQNDLKDQTKINQQMAAIAAGDLHLGALGNLIVDTLKGVLTMYGNFFASLRYLFFGMIIGLVLFLTSMGMATRILTGLPGIVASFLQSNLETVGSMNDANLAGQVMRAVFSKGQRAKAE